MKTNVFFSREQLMTMPLVALRGVDIDTPEQAELVQEVVNIKLQSLPIQRPIYRKDVPDIQTLEEEERWQAIMNRREAKIRGTIVAEDGAPTMEPVPEVAPEPTPEVATPAPAEVNPIPGPAPVMPEEGMAQPTGEGEPVTFASGVVKSQLKSRRLT